MKYLLAPLLLFSHLAWADQCFSYNDQIMLRGVLSRQTFPEQPNYESIANGDAAATYFFLKLAAPICTEAGKDQDDESDETQVKITQLIFSAAEEYSKLRPYLGKIVECRGRLMQKFSGHHHSRVLLWSAVCQPSGSSPPNL